MPDCAFCRHPHSWHEHYRDGDDCGACVDCRSYRDPRGVWRRLAEFLRRR